MLPQYLTGASNPAVRAIAKRHNLGLMITPDTAGKKATYQNHLQDYPTWAADNACFANPQSFTVDGYLAWLAWLPSIHRHTCLFATAPDVVRDARATMERSLPILPLIRAAGYPTAFIAQDGLENMLVPWKEFDALFIGGSTEWKLSEYVRRLCMTAKVKGKWVHMGRVNSRKRLKIAHSFCCDSVDGTFLAFGPDKNLPRLLSWYEKLAEEMVA